MSALTLGSSAGRRTLAASIVGSGAVFLEGTVVNVALPAIARDLDLGLEGVQWVVNAYLLALGALTLLGGALGDRYGRRRLFGLWRDRVFRGDGGLCVAPGSMALLVLRFVQGSAGAMLVPNSLAMLEASFSEEERGTAIGRWAGWSAVSTAIGPLLVDGWWMPRRGVGCSRSIAPVALAAAWLALGGGETSAASARGKERSHRLHRRGADRDGTGRADGGADRRAALGFGARSSSGCLSWVPYCSSRSLWSSIVRRRRCYLQRCFTPRIHRGESCDGAHLRCARRRDSAARPSASGQLGYSALQSGAALLPVNALMLTLSPLAGRLAHRHGARGPMAVGR